MTTLAKTSESLNDFNISMGNMLVAMGLNASSHIFLKPMKDLPPVEIQQPLETVQEIEELEGVWIQCDSVY